MKDIQMCFIYRRSIVSFFLDYILIHLSIIPLGIYYGCNMSSCGVFIGIYMGLFIATYNKKNLNQKICFQLSGNRLCKIKRFTILNKEKKDLLDNLDLNWLAIDKVVYTSSMFSIVKKILIYSQDKTYTIYLLHTKKKDFFKIIDMLVKSRLLECYEYNM